MDPDNKPLRVVNARAFYDVLTEKCGQDLAAYLQCLTTWIEAGRLLEPNAMRLARYIEDDFELNLGTIGDRVREIFKRADVSPAKRAIVSTSLQKDPVSREWCAMVSDQNGHQILELTEWFCEYDDARAYADQVIFDAETRLRKLRDKDERSKENRRAKKN